MANQSINNIVEDTLAAINVNLLKLNVSADSTQIEAAFNGPIQAAYASVKTMTHESNDERDKNRIKLYRMLSLAFHPDKLPNNTKPFALTFHELSKHNQNLHNKIPQQILGSINDDTDNIIRKFRSNPVKNLNSIIIAIIDLFIKKIITLQQDTNRYNQPYRSIALYSSYIFLAMEAIVATIVLGVTFVGAILIGSIIHIVNNGLRYLVIQKHYEAELEKKVTPTLMAEKARDFFITKGIDPDDKSDEEILNWYVGEKIAEYNSQNTPEENKEKALNELKKKIKVEIGLANTITLFNAFKSAITEPLANGWINNFLSLLIRLTQAILMTPILVVDACVRLVDYATTALVIGEILLFASVGATILAFFNLPLYIYEGLSAIFSGKRSATQLATSEPVPSSSSYARILDDIPEEIITPAPTSPAIVQSDLPDSHPSQLSISSTFSHKNNVTSHVIPSKARDLPEVAGPLTYRTI